ncbi:hypothetical protein [uncultured Lactobacillus sp.]|uniref:hypothetical protein n=1 Tax=uncultured Lactobacillus sp. TaxID=153152 RepID=UPI0026195230|nr:hypothetical protein [uncultured Lactobacillus sp.]
MPILTTDIISTNPDDWCIAPDYDFGKIKKRHGSIQPISDEKYHELLEKFS